MSLPKCPPCIVDDLGKEGFILVRAYELGTKVKSTYLLPSAPDGHVIDCKMGGLDPMKPKSFMIKKPTSDSISCS